MSKEFKFIMDWIGVMVCPGCGSGINISMPEHILLNADIKRTFAVEGMWISNERCNNLLYKWSEIE